jgi:hypothetical protein
MKNLFFILLLFIQIGAFSQELRVENFKPSPLDVTAREKQVLDVNNELCGLVKVRSGLSNVKFFSNLAIEKVESHPGEYWIWLSPGSTQLKIAVQDFPLFDFKFPEKVEKSAVYTILLIAIFPEKVVYRDTASIQPFVSFTTEPSGAEVFINDIFYGKTPLKANIPEGEFTYRLEKKKYYSQNGTDKLDQKFKNLSFDIKPNPYSKRFFLIGSIGTNALPRAIYGIQAGILGKTGFYLSSTYSFVNADPDLKISLGKDLITSYVDNKNYYYLPEGSYFGTADKVYLLSVSTGLTQQLGKRFFLNFGIGASFRNYYMALNKYEYVPSSNYLPGVLNYKRAYGLVEDYSYKGINLQLGIIYRFKNNLLLSLSNTTIFRMGLYTTNASKLLYQNTEYHIGIGYSF